MEPLPTLLVSVLSGLVGASFAAYFNYRIRLSLSEKERIEKEQKLAYVYVVQLSQYAAIQVLLENFLQKAMESLEDPIPKGEFEFKHAAAVYIENALSKVDDDFFEKVDSIEKLIDQAMDGFKNTYLSNQDQAALPKQTIMFYQRYEYYLKSTAAYFKLFKHALSHKELLSIVDAKQISSFIDTVKSLFDSAGLLKAAMAQFGDIGPNTSQYIVEQQYEFYRKSVASGFENDAKIAKAREHLAETGANNANKAN